MSYLVSPFLACSKQTDDLCLILEMSPVLGMMLCVRDQMKYSLSIYLVGGLEPSPEPCVCSFLLSSSSYEPQGVCSDGVKLIGVCVCV
jgi:hypothetical protein